MTPLKRALIKKSGQDRYRQAMLEYLLHRSDQFQTVNGLMV